MFKDIILNVKKSQYFILLMYTVMCEIYISICLSISQFKSFIKMCSYNFMCGERDIYIAYTADSIEWSI